MNSIVSGAQQSSGWVWDSTVDFGTTSFQNSWRPSPSPRWQKIAMVRGIPVQVTDTFLLASQDEVSQPAWFVAAEADTPEREILRRARERYQYDQTTYHMKFISAFGQDDSGALIPIGCGGGRPWITRHYESRYWMAVGRILLMPELRGTGLAAHFMILFLEATQALFEPLRLGFIHETRSRHVPHLLAYAEKSGHLASIRLGRRRRPEDADITFISFFPNMREWAAVQTSVDLGDAEISAVSADFIDTVQDFWSGNCDEKACSGLAEFYAKHENTIKEDLEDREVLKIYFDFMEMLKHWGVLEV